MNIFDSQKQDDNARSFHIIYGWAEGSWHGKKLRKQMEANGFRFTRNVHSADIIITHSGGGFLMPASIVAKLVIVVGLPHWPGKHPGRGMVQKVRLETKNKHWLKKTTFNTLYFIRRPRRWYQMWRAWKFSHFPEATDSRRIVAIHNHDDVFIQPEAASSLCKRLGWKLVTMPGEHDSIWIDPKPYVELTEKEYARILT